MHVFASLGDVALTAPQAVTIGSFDGVHRGHQFLLKQTQRLAQVHGAQTTVITFWPPPISVLQPDRSIHVLMLPDEKAEALAQLGIDNLITVPFTSEFAHWSAERFMEELAARMPVHAVAEGDDFSMGYQRAGTLAWLADYGAAHGIQVERVTRQAAHDEIISSTRIRSLVAVGEMGAARYLLGRPYHVRGEVVHGDARGRKLGYPTANLALDPLKLIPANGIYAVRAWEARDPATVWMGAASIGVRPVFGGGARLVEVYLLDVTLDLYGSTLCVDFIERLREERTFPSVADLITQMGADVAAARCILGQETGAAA
jgi:riboflavin kinase / FMN adenylyltransferase